MKYLKLLFGFLLLFFCRNIYAQYMPTPEDLLVSDVEGEFEPYIKTGGISDYYNDLRTWMPYCNSEPLKNPPITYLEITFHVFFDDNGGNNKYTNTPEGRSKLLSLLDYANQCYSGYWGPSDPVPNVVELPNYDTRIRLTLGDNNERIYFYNNTSLNHTGDEISCYNYVADAFPSRVSKLNVFFVAAYYGGRVRQDSIKITNGGSGYTSVPTIEFSYNPDLNESSAKGTAVIENGVLTGINLLLNPVDSSYYNGYYNSYDPPTITIEGGGGSGATAIVTGLAGGASGYANTPSTTLSSNSKVVMCTCHDASSWYGMVLAHEIGHNLDLRHTYCIYPSPTICSEYCSLGCGPCNDDEYLSDIFGPCPGTYPHSSSWNYDPYDPNAPNAAKITNNVMSSTSKMEYFSPMQAGQMHRTLALKSTRKYVRADCYSSIPLVISGDEDWDFDIKLYRDIRIASGGVLTLSGKVTLPADKAKIVVQSGGRLKIPANKTIDLDIIGDIIVEAGGYLELGNNVKITGSNPNRLIRIQDGTVITGSNIVVETLRFQTTASVSNIHFDNVSFVRNQSSAVFNMGNCTFDNSIVKLHNQKSNANVTNCTFTDTEINPDASLKNVPTVVKFSNSQFCGSPLFHSKHKLEATNCEFSDRSDIVATHPVVDIDSCYFWKSGFKAGTSSELPMPGITPFTPFVKITGSSFNNTGRFITGYDKLELPIYSTASIMLDGIKEFQITYNTITNANASNTRGFPPHPYEAPNGEGIYLNNAGNGSVNNRRIQDNKISQCQTGLYVYGSKAQILGNEIYENTYGARLFNNSQTTFIGFTNGPSEPDYGYQIISDNGSYEVYASNNCFPAPFIYNQIIDEDNNGNTQDDPLIYYDETNSKGIGFPPGHELMPINISCNYWGVNFDHNEDIYPSNRFITSPIWDPQTGECSSGGKGLYDAGIDYFAEEDYLSAQATFLELIETYPDDPFAIAALHEFFALEQFLDNDYAALHDFYAAFTPADSSLFDVADFLATRCNVVIENWQPAIDWYEDRIENPPSYQDSVFAVIDLGDIHLMMGEDTSFLKSGRTFLTRFPNIKPKSKQEYEENKSELLATLPKIDKPQQDPLAELGKKGVLSQNIPNPANESTTIVYDVIKEGSVELRLYNQLGQLLQALPQGTKKQGSYRVEISLVGLPAGMYHYVLFVEGEKADARKLIVN